MARAYRAACPNCGAPVDFASASSASAVCGFCRSTLVRDGEALRRIGASAELFDDHSPLALGATGRRQGEGFALVGRLQYGYRTDGTGLDGTWNEWHALFDNGKRGWLSEDNGAYVFAFDAPAPADLPDPDALSAGTRCLADGRAWDVASVVRAHLLAAAGELPAPPRLEGEFSVAELRNAAGEVATIDGTSWSIGRSVRLADLALQGLREVGEKTLSARSLACPSCGAAIEVRLAGSKSITCAQCSAVVDLSKDEGLGFFAQAAARAPEPPIPLGRVGTLALGGPALPWQVVGWMERRDLPEDAEEESTAWRELLLHHPSEGFAFLIDTDEGWSWARVLTGAPLLRGDQANWAGETYRRKWTYAAKITWVQGEFYWRVQRDETAQVSDFEGLAAASRKRLSREQTAGEVTWSGGEVLDAAVVAAAFGVEAATRAPLPRDATPLAGGGLSWASVWPFVLFIVIVLLITRCSDDDCEDLRRTFGAASPEARQCESRGGIGVRSGGGSYGGWSSGGGHK